MKKTTSLIVLMFFSIFTYSQKLAPDIIISQGEVSISDSMSIEWILGDNLVETLNVKNEFLTQGFTQPIITIDIEEVNKIPNDHVLIGPNPMSSFLRINFQSNLLYTSDLEIGFFDVNGRLVKQIKAEVVNNSVEIKVGNLKTGMYILKIIDDKGIVVESFKVIKN